MATAIRLGAIVLGLVCAALGCYGAYEYAHGLEGKVSYLVIAAPVIAAAAALIPVFAEVTWRKGAHLKALLWWAALAPAVAVVFFGAAERVHVAKAGAQAERDALRSASVRTEVALASAQAALVKAQASASKARAQKQCGPSCRATLDAEAVAKANVEASKGELLRDQKLATMDSPIQAPVWLLPAAIDVVAFMSLWTGLAGFVRSGAAAKAPAKKAPRKTSTTAGKRKPRQTKPKRLTPRERAEALFEGGNDNVVNFPAAATGH